jgi:hypothetical protein
MWNNVFFKASFERRKKEGTGPFATYHMNENLGFMPTNEGIKHVEENNTLVIEKEMSGPTFATLLHEISKCVQEEPQHWKNKPKSLLLTASFVAAQNMSVRQLCQQPRELVEETACHLPPTEIVDFMRMNKFLYGLKGYFTPSALQKFLLHFYKTYERTDLKRYTKQYMKRVKKCMKWAVFDITREEMKQARPLDWVITSLGCFKQLEQFDARFVTEFRFFSLKFRHERQYLRFPIPKVPFMLSRIVPEKDYSESDLPELDDDFEKHKTAYLGPIDLKNEFFTLLCAMEEGVWRGSHHEVLAYGAQLLCEEKFLSSQVLQKYYLFVWGNMAVSLSKLHVPELFPLSCLEKMIPQCFAFKIDAMHFKQQVMAAYEQYEEEEELFSQMFEIIPTCSFFFRKIVIVHMSAVQKMVEDMLMEIYGGLKMCENKRDDHLQDEINRLVKRLLKECDKNIKLMHVLCSITKSCEYLEDYEHQISVMKVYKEICVCFQMEWVTEQDFHPIMVNIRNHISFPWNYKIKVDTFNEYHQQLFDLKRELQKQTRMVYPKAWADVCYFQLLFLKALRDPQPQNFTDVLYYDAVFIYSLLNHPREKRLENLYKRHQPFTKPRFEDKVESMCSILWLVKNAPRVKTLIRNGISSAEKFDLWDASSYWQPLR